GVSFAFGGAPVRATLSVGVATWPEVEVQGAEELISSADAALYMAKQGGRDRVHQALPTPRSQARAV
ncbi:MAG TPA: diguanylate cyclase, partial [Longimicrobiaceae bacterium]|nr:diguanylate cyclase [Longimicrobiaceae bacterium]